VTVQAQVTSQLKLAEPHQEESPDLQEDLEEEALVDVDDAVEQARLVSSAPNSQPNSLQSHPSNLGSGGNDSVFFASTNSRDIPMGSPAYGFSASNTSARGLLGSGRHRHAPRSIGQVDSGPRSSDGTHSAGHGRGVDFWGDSPHSPHSRASPGGRRGFLSSNVLSPREAEDPSRLDSAKDSMAWSVTEDFVSEAWDLARDRALEPPLLTPASQAARPRMRGSMIAGSSSLAAPSLLSGEEEYRSMQSDCSILDLHIDWDLAKAEFKVYPRPGALGIDLLNVTSEVHIVTAINDSGAIAEWNATAQKDQKVCIGDALLAAEGLEAYELELLAEAEGQSSLPRMPTCITFRHDSFILSIGYNFSKRLSLGVQFGDADQGRALLVDSIHEGLLQEWNIQAEVYDFSLDPGDIILEVNGVSRDAKRMLEAIKSTNAWEFKAVHVNKIWNPRRSRRGVLEAIDSPVLSSIGGSVGAGAASLDVLANLHTSSRQTS